MLPGEQGDRRGQRERTVSDAEVEAVVLVAELAAMQRERLGCGQSVDRDQQRRKARIERDTAIRGEGADGRTG